MAVEMDLLVTHLGEGPSPEDEAIARLTAAHAAAQQARDQAQDPGPETTNPPDREA